MLHGKMKGATPSHDTESLYRIFVGTVRVEGCSSRMPFLRNWVAELSLCVPQNKKSKAGPPSF